MKKIISVTMCMMMIAGAFTAISGITASGENNPPSLTADPTLVADIQMEDAAGQYATDSTSNGNDAFLGDLTTPQDCDPVWSSGPFGGCLDFNGTTDMLTLPDSASMHLAAQTIEFWAEVPVGGDECKWFKEEFNSNASLNQVCYMYTGGRIQYVFNDGWHDVDTGPGAFTPGGWQHFAITRSGSPSGIARIYVDGVELANDTYAGFEFDSSKPLTIGGYNLIYNTNDHFDGKMDKIRVWSRELSAAEIMYSFTGTSPPFRIDSNADFAAHASSGNGGNTNPWIIDNLEINGTGLGYGIYIGNTTDHFILRNCTVWGADGVAQDPFYPDAGIVFYNVTKGNILNCTSHNNSGSGILLTTNLRNVTVNGTKLADNQAGLETWNVRNSKFSNLTCTGSSWAGIYIDHSQNINITDSKMTGNVDGIRLIFGNGIKLRDNNASSNQNGIILMGSNNNEVLNNTMMLNNEAGIGVLQISVNGSTVNTISGNIVRSNGGMGISIDGAATQLNTVSGNNVTYNAGGIAISTSNNNTVTDNWISSNSLGMTIQSAYNNSVFHNHFMNNVNQAYDDSANNWNDAYPSGGNFWSDYSGIDTMNGPLQDQPGSDGIGDTNYTIDADSVDLYPLWYPTDMDSIRIMDGPNGTGSVVPDRVYPAPWFNITLWAVGWNSTYDCYVRDISVNWTNVNYSGAQSSIENATGYSTTWQAGPNFGVALLTANYSVGMTRNVNVTIADYIPDIMIDGKTDDVIEDPPITQISWKNMTQGGSVPYSIVAENDGATTGTFSLGWDTSGLPGTFYAVLFNDDAGTNVTAAINAGTLSFNLAPGGLANFTLRINSTTNAGFGQTGSVNIGLFPPTGIHDSAGAIAQIYEPDYITLTGTPNGAPLNAEYLQVSQSLTVYASAYNATGPTYLGLVPVDWSITPTLGTFNNATGTSSVFTAASTGGGTIEGTATGLNDTFIIFVSPYDNTNPASQITPLGEYWFKNSQIEINATATDDVSGTIEVRLWWSHSADNSTWGNWTMWPFIDVSSPWSWPFAFPAGYGYYRFYTTAVDFAGNTEMPPAQADAACAYDGTAPEITDNSQPPAETGNDFTVNATVSDDMALHGVHLIYRFGTGAEVNLTMTGTGQWKTASIDVPDDSLDTLHYRIAAVDRAKNWNTTAVSDVPVIDDDAPEADAGGDMDAETGDEIVFDGSASSDNIDIENYTWAFTYNGTTVYLYGLNPAFTFWTAGNYSVTLTVSDAEGLESTDTFTVSVTEAVPVDDDDDDDDAEGSIADYWWIIIIIIVVMLVLLLILLKRRKKDDEEPQDENTPAGESGNPTDSDSGTASGPPGSI